MSYIHDANLNLKPLIEKLMIRYPFLSKRRSLLKTIFNSWFSEGDLKSHVYNMVYYAKKYGYKYPTLTLKQIFEKCSNTYMAQFTYLTDYKPSDYLLVVSAAEFYGEDIEVLVSDVSKIIFIDELSAKLNKRPELLAEVLSAVSLYLTLTMSKLFFYLRIGTIIENLYIDKIESVCRYIIVTIENNESIRYDDAKNFLKGAFRPMQNNYDGELVFKDFFMKALYQIYDIYKKGVRMMSFIAGATDATDADRDNIMKICPDTHYIKGLSKYNILLLYVMNWKSDEGEMAEEIIEDVFCTRVTNLSEKYLVIEI